MFDPNGYKSGPIGPGWADYALNGVPSSQYTIVHRFPVRVTLDRTTEDGDSPGWTVTLYEGTWEKDLISVARTALDKGLSSGLPDPSRVAVVPFARLEPDPARSGKISPVMTMLPLKDVTDIPASSLPAAPGMVNVQRRLTDLVKNGVQYLAVTGGKPMPVPVVDAVPVRDQTPQTNRFVPNVWQAVVAPGLPAMMFTTDRLHNTRLLPRPYSPDTRGVITEQGTFGAAGYTDSVNNGDVIIRFPAQSGASPIYVSTVQVLNQEALNYRQKAENNIQAGIEAAARTEEVRKAQFAQAGIQETPAYTPEMVRSANAMMASSGAMVLNRAPAMIQLSTTSNRVMTTSSKLAGWVSGALWRGAVTVAEIATASTAGVAAGAFVVGFWPSAAGGKSDSRVPGRDINMLAAQANLFTAGKTSITPGMTSVNLPVRGFISTNNDGSQSVNLVKTGTGGIQAAVPVLNAVRDKASGLDRITVPAVAGAPSRTILVNPVPVGPAAPQHTGNTSPQPVTSVHTGTDIKQADSIVTTTFPTDEIPPLQDFIYWQPNSTGTGIEPIYVMLNDPLDSGRFTRRQLQKKYKHAIDFGISDTRINSDTLTKLRDAVEAHLSDKNTIVKGTYIREKGSKVYFNTETNNAVVIRRDGLFSTGMKLKPGTPQYKNYIEKGVLL